MRNVNGTPDWGLVAEGLSSLDFLRRIVGPENHRRKACTLISNHIADGGFRPLSPGTLIAFSYLAIVYPKNRKPFGVPNALIEHRFEESKPSKTNSELLSHLRNALAHGDFRVTDDQIIFHHKDWKARISYEDMTAFLHDIFATIVAQHYVGMSHAPTKMRS